MGGYIKIGDECLEAEVIEVTISPSYKSNKKLERSVEVSASFSLDVNMPDLMTFRYRMEFMSYIAQCMKERSVEK